MKKVITLLLASFISLMLTSQNFQVSDPITLDLHQEMEEASNNDLLRINIRLKDQFNATEFMSRRNNLTHEQGRQKLVSELKLFTHEKQKEILAELNYYSRSDEVKNIKALWIANVINCYATPETIEQLATRDDVERIDIDEERILLSPFSIEGSKGNSTREIVYNVLLVNAPDVWALGFTGEGIVVAVLDTGVNYNHNDITNNMWTHPDYPYHGWNFIGNNNNPMDFHGHGTHCAGTVAGDGTSGSQTGMAPGAQIMALQVLSSGGGGTEAGVWSGIQFGVEHGAHVLSLSLGWAHAWGPDRASWRDAMNNALAAGVIASVAAGNEGNQQGSHPIPSNVRTPGDCPPPWLHPDQTLIGGTSAVVTVGATNSNDNLAALSSRGPVTWQNVSGFNDYPYNPGIGLIMPDIVAPGVSVKSLSHTNISGYTTMSGTSMAAPGVAGVMALVLSKNPSLLPEQISQILEETTLVLTPGKNNNTGSGRVDALAAFNATSFPGPVYYSHEINDEAGNNDGSINPSEFIQLTIALLNNTDEIFENVEALVFTNSPYITMVDSIAMYGTFLPGDTIAVENAFSFEVANNIPGDHEIQFFVITGDGTESWESNFKENANAPILGSGSMIIFDPEGNGNGILDPGEEANIQIPTLNTGQMQAEDVMVTFTTDNPYITILTTQLSLGTIEPGGIQMALFPVIVDPATPLGEDLLFTYTVVSGHYTYERTYTHKVAMMLEDFETNDFSKYDWTFFGNLPWVITNVNPYEGTYSAKSGAINHNHNSGLQITMNVAENDSISFYFKVSSETNFDYLRFFIGAEMMDQWAGEVPWQRIAYAVTPGSKTFRWEFDKDHSVSSGSDCAWLDYITLPQPLVTTAYAGLDVLICEGETVQLEGTAMNYISIMWHTSGTGAFSDPTILNPVYTPSLDDIEAGNVTLILSVSNPSNDQITDQLTLTIQQEAQVFAGDDHIICASDYYYTDNAMASQYDGLLWASSGSGIFADPEVLHTTYIPSDEDIAAGFVNLTLHAYGILPCGDEESSFLLSFSPDIILDAGEDMQICGEGVVELNAMVDNYSSLLWSGSGTGSFDDVTIANPIYIPSEDDITAGSVNLWIEVSGIAPCNNVTDTINIVFLSLPTVEITGATTICEGESAVIHFTLTGLAPWTLTLSAAPGVIVINESPFELMVEPVVTTVYSILTVSDANACEINDAGEITITVNPLPLVPEMPTGPDTVDIAYNTSSVYTLRESAFATSYLWEIDPAVAGSLSPDGTTLTVNWDPNFIGDVSIRAKAINDCGESAFSENKVTYLKNTTGIGNLGSAGRIRVFPNPSEGLFTLEIKSVKSQVLAFRVYNQLGRIVESFEYTPDSGTSSLPLDLRKLPDGLYMLQIKHQDGSLSKKLIINR